MVSQRRMPRSPSGAQPRLRGVGRLKDNREAGREELFYCCLLKCFCSCCGEQPPLEVLLAKGGLTSPSFSSHLFSDNTGNEDLPDHPLWPPELQTPAHQATSWPGSSTLLIQATQ